MIIQKEMIKSIYQLKDLGIEMCITVSRHEIENNLPTQLYLIDAKIIDDYRFELGINDWCVFRPILKLEDEIWRLINKKYCNCHEKDFDIWEECKCNIPSNEELTQEVYTKAFNHIVKGIEEVKTIVKEQ